MDIFYDFNTPGKWHYNINGAEWKSAFSDAIDNASDGRTKKVHAYVRPYGASKFELYGGFVPK